jgi:hypothetical protein
MHFFNLLKTTFSILGLGVLSWVHLMLMLRFRYYPKTYRIIALFPEAFGFTEVVIINISKTKQL